MAPGSVRDLAWLCAIGVFVAIAQSMTLPLVALYAQSLGAAPGAIGLVLGVGFVLPVLTAISIGTWVDRVGARRMILAGAIGLAIAPVLPVIAPSLAALALLQIVSGVSHLSGVVAAQSYVARVAGPRERNFGWYTTFVSVGQLVGPFAVGVAIELLGYRGALVLSGSTGLAAALLSRGLPPVAVRAVEAPSPSHAMPRSPTYSPKSDLVTHPPLRLALLASGATLFALGVHQTFFPIYLDVQSISPAWIGGLVSLRALSAILVRPFLAPLGRLVGRRSVMLGLTLLLCGVGLALIPMGSAVGLFATASVLLGIGSGIAQPMTMVVLSDHVLSERRGAALGARLSINFLALGLSTILLGAAIPVLGYAASFLLCGAIPAFVAVWVGLGKTGLEAPQPILP